MQAQDGTHIHTPLDSRHVTDMEEKHKKDGHTLISLASKLSHTRETQTRKQREREALSTFHGASLAALARTH